MHYCKSDRYNDDIIDKRRIKVENIISNISAYSLVYMEQVLEFVDLIFDNNLDKIYFLRQYLKSFKTNESENAYPKARTLTKEGIIENPCK